MSSNLDSILLIIKFVKDKNSRNKGNLANLKNKLFIIIYAKNAAYKKILFKLTIKIRERFTARIFFIN